MIFGSFLCFSSGCDRVFKGFWDDFGVLFGHSPQGPGGLSKNSFWGAFLISNSKADLAYSGRVDHLAVISRLLSSDRLGRLLWTLRRGRTSAEPAPPLKAMRIGIFVQLTNLAIWSRSLKPCIERVFEAAKKSPRTSIDVILSATEHHDHLDMFLEKLRTSEHAPGVLRYDFNVHGESRAGDNGLFLQQLLYADEHALDHDVILKLHSKLEFQSREAMLNDLCGDVSWIQSVIAEFVKDDGLGMVGPSNWTWSREAWPTKFNAKAVRKMDSLWSYVTHNAPPPEGIWRLVIGSFYWVRRQLPMWQESLLPNIPILLKSCDASYTRGFEMLMPTLVAATHKVSLANQIGGHKKGGQAATAKTGCY